MDDLSQKRESKSTSFISVITLSSAGLGGSHMEKSLGKIMLVIS